ncbi:tyrosine-type recombinase/integrase [Cupriavidus basilensis]|uniref:tyrosine-type recombinase/integrase n=1 Tax=Cupriavidus basilensis TaxID=68895 RepID=UPI003D347785
MWFWGAFVKTLYFTGMRRRQILNLEWRDIDVEQRAIHLRSETSETRRSYDIPVPQSLLSELGTYRKIDCKRLGGANPNWKIAEYCHMMHCKVKKCSIYMIQTHLSCCGSSANPAVNRQQ